MRAQKKTLTLEDVLGHIVEVRSSLGHKIIQFLFDKQEEYVPEICERIVPDGSEEATSEPPSQSAGSLPPCVAPKTYLSLRASSEAADLCRAS